MSQYVRLFTLFDSRLSGHWRPVITLTNYPFDQVDQPQLKRLMWKYLIIHDLPVAGAPLEPLADGLLRKGYTVYRNHTGHG